MTNLPPCQRCGADKAYTRVGGTGYQIVCDACGLATRSGSEAEAIALWSHRPSLAEALNGARDMTTFSARNLQRCEAKNGFNHPINSWSLSDWFTAMMGELGEAANVAKKLNRVRDGIKGNKESEQALIDKLRKELGDTLCYLDLLATSRGFSIFDAAVEVFDAKSKEIGYDA